MKKNYDELLEEIAILVKDKEWEEACLKAREAVERNRLNLRANFYLAVALTNLQKWLESLTYFTTLHSLQKIFKESVIEEEECLSFISFVSEKAQETLSRLSGLEYDGYQTILAEINAEDKDLQKNMFCEKQDMENYFGMHYFSNRLYFLGRYDNWFNSYWRPDTNQNAQVSKGEIYEIASVGKEYAIQDPVPCILPIVANAYSTDNEITLMTKGNQNPGPYIEGVKKTYSYYRVEEPLHITAKNVMLFGKPIPLRHQSDRKRLVLNIFLDSFNWRYIKDYGLEQIMPNTFHFFEEGIICNQFYSGSEFTYPSVASYWTGLRSTHHGMLNQNVCFPIPERFPLLSEIFHDKGYVTAKIGGNDAVVPNYGYIRGVDRFLYERGEQNFHVQNSVCETIEHLEAFKEADNFLWIEIDDLHEVAGYWGMPISVQSHCPPETNQVDNTGGSSLYQSFSPNRHVVYGQQLRHIDTYLSSLYQYIRRSYKKEEVVVALISDHGNGFNVADGQPFLSDQRMNVPLLLYADGNHEHICEEKIETIDYGHILCKLSGIKDDRIEANDGQLPRFFGGETEKEYVFSQSLFPDRYYEAAIFAKEYKFYFKSSKKVSNDCRISLRDGQYVLWDENDNPKVDAGIVSKCINIIIENLGDYLLDKV